MAINALAVKVAQLTGHNSSIFSIVPFGQSRYFISGGGEGWIVLWDLDTPELGQLKAKVGKQIFSLWAKESSNLAVAGNMDGGLHWVNFSNASGNRNISHHTKGVFSIVEAEGAVWTIGGEGMLTKWSANPIKSLESLQLTNMPLRCMDYSSFRNELAIGSSDCSVYLVDTKTMEIKRIIKAAHANSVFSVKYHPVQPLLITGGRDAHLKVWDLEREHEARISIPAHLFTINSIVFHPEGHFMATGSRDKTIKIWDASSFELVKVIETVRDRGHVNSVNTLYWSSYNNYLISGSDDRSIIIWEINKV